MRGRPKECHFVARAIGQGHTKTHSIQTSIIRTSEEFKFSMNNLLIFLNFQEGFSAQSVTRSRRIQRELEAAEERAEVAESNLNMVRTKHRTFVTTSTVPGSQVYLVSETVRQSSIERA